MALGLMLVACSCASVSDRAPADERPKVSGTQVTGSVLVMMVQAENGNPADGANVTVLGARRYGMSDPDGLARFDDLSPGIARFKVQAIGRKSVVDSVLVRAGATDTLRFVLAVNPDASIVVDTLASRRPRREP